MTDSGHVEYSVDGHVATITFSRPAKKNAFTHAMYEQLDAALGEADGDARVHAIVLTGAGGAFTAGNDLGDFMRNPPTGGESPVFRVIRKLAFADKPLVAAVSGAAVGIGTTMLLHCDLVVVDPSARLSLPFVALGLTPEAGSSYLLPRLAGLQAATELLLLGDPFGAERAIELGIANRISAVGEVLATATALAERLAEQPAAAVQAAKRLIREPIRRQLSGVLQDEGVTFVQRLASPEAAEAFERFFAKSKR